MTINREDCLKQIDNAFILAIVAAKRARRLNSVAREKNIHQLKELSFINTTSTKAGEIALEEIAAGKISFQLKDNNML